jgi:chromosome partitioning protein
VLVADIDPQGNTTSGLGVDKNALTKSIYDLLLGNSYLEEVALNVAVDGLTLLPANINLSGAEIELINESDREYRLRGIFAHAKYLYDFILIDCPPSLNILTLNAMCAADTVLVPIQCEFYALEGLTQLMHTISLVQKKLNPRLTIEGVVFTMFDARTNLSTQVVDEVKAHLAQHVYKSIIPRSVRLAEAPSHGLPITLYDAASRGAVAYKELAQEVIKKER